MSAPFQIYSALQQKLLIAIPMFTGSISSIASMRILHIIRRNYRRNMGALRTYDKVMACLSIVDIICSINIAVSSLPVPAETGVWLAMGNQTTCEISAFFNTWQLGVYLYNMDICIIFLLLTRYRKPETWIKKHLEAFLLWVPMLTTLVASILPFKFTSYNYDGLARCFFSSEPLGCIFNPNVPCERGQYSLTLAWFILGIPFIFTFTFITGSMIALYLSGKESEEYLQRQLPPTQDYGDSSAIDDEDRIENTNNEVHESQTSRNIDDSNISRDIERTRPTNNALERQINRLSQLQQKRKQIVKYGLMYSLGFFLTQIFIFIRRLNEFYGSGAAPFSLILLDRFFFPMQGLFNYIIFTHATVNTSV